MKEEETFLHLFLCVLPILPFSLFVVVTKKKALLSNIWTLALVSPFVFLNFLLILFPSLSPKEDCVVDKGSAKKKKKKKKVRTRGVFVLLYPVWFGPKEFFKK